jgi:hypothetical protein
MINHVVLFKLKEFPAEEKTGILAELKVKLEGLKNKIEVLKYIEVGINHEVESKSFDLVLISHFETLDDLEEYRVHPEHVKVAGRVGEVAAARAAVDYVF